MKVKDLINELLHQPQDMDVAFVDYDCQNVSLDVQVRREKIYMPYHHTGEYKLALGDKPRKTLREVIVIDEAL